MSLFSRKKNEQGNTRSEEKAVIDEKISRAERDMAYLEAQIRLFKKEQGRAA